MSESEAIPLRADLVVDVASRAVKDARAEAYRDGLRAGLEWVIERAFSPSHEFYLRAALRHIEHTGCLPGEAEDD